MSTCHLKQTFAVRNGAILDVAAKAGSRLGAAAAARAMQDARGDLPTELSRTATPPCTSSIAAAAARGNDDLRGAGWRCRRTQWSRSAMAALLLL